MLRQTETLNLHVYWKVTAYETDVYVSIIINEGVTHLPNVHAT